MAAKELQSQEDIDENFLLCGICSERYKNAKILLCLHSFCEQCLVQLADNNGSITCPVCRRSQELPSDGVAGISDNVFLKDIVEMYTKQESDTKAMCEACEEGEATKHCIDCSFDVCNTCAKAHAKIRSTQSHRLVTLDEYFTAKADDPSAIQPAVYCEIHPDHRLEFYCCTCDQVICSKCAALDHLKPAHQYMPVEDASKDFTGHMSSVLDKVKMKEFEIQDSKTSISKILESLDRCYQKEEQNVNEHIHRTIEDVTRLIQENGKDLLAELKGQYERRKTELTAQLKGLDISEDDFTGAREYVEKLVNYGNALQLMSVKTRISDQTETLLRVKTRVDPVADDYMAFQAFDDFCRDKRIGTIRFQKPVSEQTAVFQSAKGAIYVSPVETRHATQNLKLIAQAKYLPSLKASNRSTLTMDAAEDTSGNEHQCVSCSNSRSYDDQRARTVSLRKKTGHWSEYRNATSRQQCVRRFGEPGSAKGQLSSISGIAVMRNGNALVCEYSNKRLQSFTVGGKHSKLFQFSNVDNFCPWDATVSSNGRIFCTDDGSKKVFVIDEKGRLINRSGEGKILSPYGIAISPDSGVLYVVDHTAHCVHIYDQDGNHIQSFGNLSSEAGQLSYPTFVCVDNYGNVYVSDSSNDRVCVFDGDGTFLYTFGSYDCGRSQLRDPLGVAVDNHSRVYVAEYNNNILLQFTRQGNFLSRIDDPTVGLKYPTGVCVTNDDLLMVSDCGNSCVRVFAL
ncbi:tripartite motif-containing protein 2-like [Ptychodera flava]|uniref:tripartite motif-containing protein 2-like n=1 Tax=Ptychodera flava TaxID=63121 RepID=UPI003969BF44